MQWGPGALLLFGSEMIVIASFLCRVDAVLGPALCCSSLGLLCYRSGICIMEDTYIVPLRCVACISYLFGCWQPKTLSTGLQWKSGTLGAHCLKTPGAEMAA